MFKEYQDAFFYYICVYLEPSIDSGYDFYPRGDFYIDWYKMEQPTVYRDAHYPMVF